MFSRIGLYEVEVGVQFLFFCLKFPLTIANEVHLQTSAAGLENICALHFTKDTIKWDIEFISTHNCQAKTKNKRTAPAVLSDF